MLIDFSLMFDIGDIIVCYHVQIIIDDDCECCSTQDLFITLEYASGQMPVNITQDRMHDIIN